MSLPNLFTYNLNRKSDDLENITKLRESFNPFANEMRKISEICIYLKYTFDKSEIDNTFISDIETEYATQFLTKMDFLPTKGNIKKILKLRPIEQCDFHLSIEAIRKKQLKCVHIYPNISMNEKVNERLSSLLSTNEFENQMNMNHHGYNTQSQTNSLNKKDDVVRKIKRKPIRKSEAMLYNREPVDELLIKAKEDVIEKKLYSKAGNADMKNKIDLSLESILPKYIYPSRTNILKRSLDDNHYSKIRLINIRLAKKNDIINNPKYSFPLLMISLSKEAIDEINQPIDISIETIMKDVNYILDNFPVQGLIDLNDQNEGEFSSSRVIYKDNTLKQFNKQLYTKLKSFSKEEVVLVYKQIQSKEIYRIIGISINLIYWIVFGSYNRIQIDQSTKHYLLIKLLREKDRLDIGFEDKKVYHTLFIPFLIIVLRLECENVFNKKFKQLFSIDSCKQIAFEKYNEVITVIYDPDGFHNTFSLINGNNSSVRHRLKKELQPRYKSNSCSTSGIIDQLFTKVRIEKINKSKNTKLKLSQYWSEREKENAVKDEEVNQKTIDDQKKFIAEHKISFYRDVLIKINRRLKRRHLDPIFDVDNGNNDK